jgi:4-hydroxy-tetrahydrodipicolinate synthase
MQPQEFRDKLKGPVFPIPTFFTDDFAVDYSALKRYVAFLLDAGAKILYLAYGTGEFMSLSYEEIKEIARTVAQMADGRALLFTDTGTWATTRVVEFANWVEGIGLDGLMVMYPFYSSYYGPAMLEDAVYQHFEAIAEKSSIPLLLHTVPFLTRSGPVPYSFPLLCRIAEIDQVVGVKDMSGNPWHQHRLIKAVGDRMKMIAGGSKRQFLYAYLYGGVGYLPSVGSFAPQWSFRFYNALLADDLTEATRIADEKEAPFHDKALDFGSWMATLKTALELCGLPGGPMRPPAPNLSPAQRAELVTVMGDSGLL